jgi:hypothetical protein
MTIWASLYNFKRICAEPEHARLEIAIVKAVLMGAHIQGCTVWDILRRRARYRISHSSSQ